MPTDLPSRIDPSLPEGAFRRFLARWSGGAGTREERRSDLTLAALGITLGLTAAIFPWYVFFNQEQFGVRAMRFEGNGEGGPAGRMPADLPFPTELVERPVEEGQIPLLQIDRFATGNVPTDDNPTGSVPVTQQPFPGQEKPAPRFEIVHVENGRIMVADDGGVWLARVGSRLPDASKIASIERRDGKWVVITDGGAVLKPKE
jgi:hypothetical protein